MRRRRFYQIVFTAAGLYNMAWGIYSLADPQWFFRFAGLPSINHAAIFACLGMVIGLYGLLYLYVGRRPEGKSAIVTVGFAGKIFGPIGMGFLVLSGAWPAKAMLLCLTNDIIWLVPFGMYLVDSRVDRTA